jgi:hypothetical protein
VVGDGEFLKAWIARRSDLRCIFQRVSPRRGVRATPWGYRQCVLFTGLGTQLLSRRETALFAPKVPCEQRSDRRQPARRPAGCVSGCIL